MDDLIYWHHRGPGKDIYPSIRLVAPENPLVPQLSC